MMHRCNHPMWDASPPTLETVGTKNIWSASTFATRLDRFFSLGSWGRLTNFPNPSSCIQEGGGKRVDEGMCEAGVE